MTECESLLIGEAELAARFAAGEPGSVAEMYRAHGRLVYTATYRVLGDAGLAEDATEQTFVQAWQDAASFDPSCSLARWLVTIAGRAAGDIFRHNRRHRDVDALTRSGPGPVSPTLSAEQIHDVWQVRRALDTLPEQDRELIRLEHDRQLTHTEIADRLAMPLDTVRSRSFRAHRSLAGVLRGLRAEPEAVDSGDGHQASR